MIPIIAEESGIIQNTSMVSSHSRTNHKILIKLLKLKTRKLNILKVQTPQTTTQINKYKIFRETVSSPSSTETIVNTVAVAAIIADLVTE